MRNSGVCMMACTALAFLSTGGWRAAGAQGATDTTRRDSQVVANGGGAVPITDEPTLVRQPMPADVHGYQIADSLRLGVGNLTQYTYLHDRHDKITVFVSAYSGSSALRTQDDTITLIQGDVDALRQQLYTAFKNGDLRAFRAFAERGDDLHASGRTIRGYELVAGVTHVGGVTAPPTNTPLCENRDATVAGAMPRMCIDQGQDRAFQAYVYYAAYALPNCLVRIRAEFPRQVAADDDARDFSHKLIASLVAH
jgi:hypothetical protein